MHSKILEGALKEIPGFDIPYRSISISLEHTKYIRTPGNRKTVAY